MDSLLLPLLAIAAHGETFAVIHGRVVLTEDGLPLPDIEVELTGSPLTALRRAVTNAHGDFLIAAVPRGSRYTLTAALPGIRIDDERHRRNRWRRDRHRYGASEH